MKACLRKAKADDKVGGKDADWMPPRYSLETRMWQKNCFVKTWSCKWSFLPCHQPISICPNGWTWVKRQETSLLSYHHYFCFVLWCLFTSIPSTELVHLSNTCFYNNKQKRKKQWLSLICSDCIPRRPCCLSTLSWWRQWSSSSPCLTKSPASRLSSSRCCPQYLFTENLPLMH